MVVEKDSVYRDLQYNCDLVIQDVGDSVVLIKEIESQNCHLYPLEEFSNNKRFTLK